MEGGAAPARATPAHPSRSSISVSLPVRHLAPLRHSVSHVIVTRPDLLQAPTAGRSVSCDRNHPDRRNRTRMTRRSRVSRPPPLTPHPHTTPVPNSRAIPHNPPNPLPHTTIQRNTTWGRGRPETPRTTACDAARDAAMRPVLYLIANEWIRPTALRHRPRRTPDAPTHRPGKSPQPPARRPPPLSPCLFRGLGYIWKLLSVDYPADNPEQGPGPNRYEKNETNIEVCYGSQKRCRFLQERP